MAQPEDLEAMRDLLESLDTLGDGQEGEATEGDVSGVGSSLVDDPELEGINASVREMEEEAEPLEQLQPDVDEQGNLGCPPDVTSPQNSSIESRMEIDSRSIYVGNIDYGEIADELEQHFQGCGFMNRITVTFNRYNGYPKGNVFIEFAEQESVQTAMALNRSCFRGRQIKVMPKRTNLLGFKRTNPYTWVRRGYSASGSSYNGNRPTRRPRGYRGRSSYYMPY